MWNSLITSAQKYIEDAKRRVQQFLAPKPASTPLPKVSQQAIQKVTSGGGANLSKPSFTQSTQQSSATLTPKTTQQPNYTSVETRKPAYAPPPTPAPISLVDTARRYTSSALDKLKSSVGELVNTGFRTPLLPGLKGSPTIEQSLESAGKLLQKFPDTTIRNTSQTPSFIFNPITNRAGEFVTSLPGEIVRQTGQAAELFGSEKGRGKIARGATEVPGQVKKITTPGQRLEGVSELFENPATIALFGLTNVIPGGGVVPKVGKKAVKEAVGKEAIALAKKEAEKVAKKGVENLTKEQMLKEMSKRGTSGTYFENLPIEELRNEYKKVIQEPVNIPKTVEPTTEEIKAAEEQALSEGVTEMKAGGGKYGNYQDIATKMKNFLRIAGEKKSTTSKELFREHIPSKVFGVSSDEVASSLGMSENQFMAELTADIEMVSSGRATAQNIARISNKVNRIKYSNIYDKLDPQFYNFVKEWDNTVKSISVEATPETLAKAEAKKVAEEAKTAAQAEKQALKEQGVPITPTQQATKIGETIKKATEANLEVPVAVPYEGSKIKGIYQRLLLPAEKVVSDQGVAGKRLSELLDLTHREGSINAGKAVTSMQQAIKKLSDEELARFADVAEGKIVADTPALQEVMNVWNSIRNDIATQAENLGLEIKLANGAKVPFTPRENFYPHFVPEEVIDNVKARKDAFVRMVNEGYASSVAEAEQKFNQFAYSKMARRYGNLEKAREADFPIYEKDPRKVLYNYIDRAYRRLSDAKHLGSNDELAYELANRVGVEGGDMQLVTQVLNRILGKENIDTFAQGVARNLMGFQTITKLDVGSAVVNLGQSISTALRTNVINTAKAIGDALGKNREEARMFAQQTGEILESSIRDFERLAGGENNLVSKYIRLIQFSRTETFNRIVAANAGKRYAEELAAKLLKNPNDQAVIRELERLKLNPQAILDNGGLLEDDALRAGYQVSEDTQFRVDKQTLPLWWSSPSGRVLSQYKTFTYKQTVFLAETVKRVAKEIRQGNIKPLANFLITVGVVAPVVGEVINNIKSLVRGQIYGQDQEPLERYLNDVFSTFSLGLLSDVGTLVTGKYGTKGTAGVFAGPTGSDVLGGIEAIQSLFNDRATLSGMDEVAARTKPLLRFGISKIPFVGRPLVSNVDFLKSETQKAKETKRDLEQTYNTLLEMQQTGASKEEQNKFWNSLDKKTQNSIKDMAEDKQTGITEEEVSLRKLNVENRAEAVYNRLRDMQNQNKTQEERDAYWNRLQQVGILTPTVIKQVYRLIEEANKPKEQSNTGIFQQVAEAVVPQAYAAEKEGYTNQPTFTSGNTDWNSFVESAKRIADKENFPLAVILGQAALETGRRSNPGNNYFGIKGQGNAGGNTLSTKEQGATGLFTTTGNFAAYQTPEDSIKAYINLIKTRYPSAYALKDDPVSMIQEIKNLGYATDNNYVAKVMGTPEFRAYQNYKPAAKKTAVKNKVVNTKSQQGLFSNFMSSIFGG